MATTPLSYASLSLTQGGADTFVQGTITTGLSLENKAWAIRELLIEWGATTATGLNGGVPIASSMLGVTIAVKTLTALALATDKSTLFAAKKAYTQASAVGVVQGDKIWRFQWNEDAAPLWAADPLYCQNHSASTGGTLIAQIRIGYVVENISPAIKAALLINALQS